MQHDSLSDANPVVHSLASSYVPHLLRVPYHYPAHSSTISPPFAGVNSREEPSMPIAHRSLPLPHLCRSTHSCDAAERARSNTTRRGHRRGYAVVSVRHCTSGCVPLYGSARLPNVHVLASICPCANFTCMPGYDSHCCTFHKRISRIFQGTTVS